MDAPLKANPFQHAGYWYWTDVTGEHHGPYEKSTDALRAILRYCDPTWWDRLVRFFTL